MLRRAHRMVVVVTFDEPCTKKEALQTAKRWVPELVVPRDEVSQGPESFFLRVVKNITRKAS